MDYNLFANIEYCREFVDSIRGLINYSHVLPAIVSVFLGILIFIQNRSSILARILLALTITYVVWVTSNLTIWTGYASGARIMSAWTLIETLGVLLFLLTYYFSYVYMERRDLPWWGKGFGLLVLTPLILLAPTVSNLQYYDIQECVAGVNTAYENYSLLIQSFLAVLMFVHILYRLFITRHVPRENNPDRAQTILLGFGILTFIYAFLIGGYISAQTLDYRYELYGLFGMIVFIGILAYMIVRYQAFNIRMLAVQALTATLVLLVGAQFLFVRTPVNVVLTAVTFVFISITSVFLIRSVKKEIKLKEELAQANAGQERFIHFLSHEVKGFLTIARNGFAAIAEGDYGPVPEQLTAMAKSALSRVNNGVTTVEGILKSANLKSGKVTFKYAPFDICSAIRKRIEQAQPLLQERKLTIETILPDGDYIIVGDAEHITDHVLKNLIENAIFYTPAGSIRVTLSRKANSVVFSVKDTGVGITNEDKKRLFTEGGQGANAMKVNAHSTGHGLFIAKTIVTAHGGRIWAESGGEGKGTTFFVELPINPSVQKD